MRKTLLIIATVLGFCTNISAQEWTATINALWPAQDEVISLAKVIDIIDRDIPRTIGVNINYTDNYMPEASTGDGWTAAEATGTPSGVVLYKQVGEDWQLCAYGKPYAYSNVYPTGYPWNSRKEGVSVGFPYSSCKYTMEYGTKYKITVAEGAFYDAVTGAKSPAYTFTFSTEELDTNTYTLGTPSFTFTRTSNFETVVTVSYPEATTTNENAVLAINPAATPQAKLLDSNYKGFASTYDLAVEDGKLIVTFASKAESKAIQYESEDDSVGHEVIVPSNYLTEGATYYFQMFSNVFGWVANDMLKSTGSEISEEFVAGKEEIVFNSITAQFVTYNPKFGQTTADAIDPTPSSRNQAYISMKAANFDVADESVNESYIAIDDAQYAIYEGDSIVAQGNTNKKIDLNTDNGLDYSKSYTVKVSHITLLNVMNDVVIYDGYVDLSFDIKTIEGESSISAVEIKKAIEGKFFENGRLVIRKNGKTYNLSGVEL